MTGHFHHDPVFNVAVKCFHRCRASLFRVSFWLGLTLGFPLEHLLWERVPPFMFVTRWLGL